MLLDLGFGGHFDHWTALFHYITNTVMMVNDHWLAVTLSTTGTFNVVQQVTFECIFFQTAALNFEWFKEFSGSKCSMKKSFILSCIVTNNMKRTLTCVCCLQHAYGNGKPKCSSKNMIMHWTTRMFILPMWFHTQYKFRPFQEILNMHVTKCTCK